MKEAEKFCILEDFRVVSPLLCLGTRINIHLGTDQLVLFGEVHALEETNGKLADKITLNHLKHLCHGNSCNGSGLERHRGQLQERKSTLLLSTSGTSSTKIILFYYRSSIILQKFPL